MQPLVVPKVRIRSLIEKGKNCLFLFSSFWAKYIVRNDHRRCKEIMVQRIRLRKKRLKKHVRHSSNADRNVAKHLNNLFISLFEE